LEGVTCVEENETGIQLNGLKALLSREDRIKLWTYEKCLILGIDGSNQFLGEVG
jgi:hypothetical protein